MTLQRKTPEETGYDTVSLTGYPIGGQPVGLTRSAQLLHIAGEDWTLERWQKFVDRVNRLLAQERWIEEPKKPGDPHPSNGRTSTFLGAQWRDITSRERGMIRKVPVWLFFLRPFFDAVITKEELRD